MKPTESKSSVPWLALVLAAFVAFTCWVAATDPLGWIPVVQAKWGAQIGLDLCIALSLVWTLILRDPEIRAERPWGWILATLPLGSIAPMSFLLLRRLRATATRTVTS